MEVYLVTSADPGRDCQVNWGIFSAVDKALSKAKYIMKEEWGWENDWIKDTMAELLDSYNCNYFDRYGYICDRGLYFTIEKYILE